MMQFGRQQNRRPHTLVSAVIVTLVLLVGLSLLLYPTVADYINSLDYKKEIENYQREVQQLDDTTRSEMLAAARAYNADLLARSGQIGELTDEQRAEYESLLNPSGSGMMGYIEIKSLGIYLPVYHGTAESVLQAGVGHIEGSSLPVGGTGTHVMLSGHTGLPSSKLFSNIDELEVGDTFALHLLGEVLTYEVESTVVLLPADAEKQAIDPRRDLCTLMTCTPYGVNSHRLFVRGKRIEPPETDRPSQSEPTVEEIPAPLPPLLWGVLIALPVLLLIAAFLFVRRIRR